MPGYGPNGDMTYAQWLQWKAAGANFRGLNKTDRVVAEGTVPIGEHAGQRFQTRRDENGHDVTTRSKPLAAVDCGQDVTIRAPHIRVKTGTQEIHQ